MGGISQQLQERKAEALAQISAAFEDLEQALQQRKQALVNDLETICGAKQKVHLFILPCLIAPMYPCFPHLHIPFPSQHFLPPDRAPQVLWASVSLVHTLSRVFLSCHSTASSPEITETHLCASVLTPAPHPLRCCRPS